MARPSKGPVGNKKGGPRVNKDIRAAQVRLIEDKGEGYGVVSLAEAFRIGEDLGLDLVEIAPTAEPPVVKLIDYGKFKYREQKRIAEAKKKQVTIAVKEIKFRPNIDKHDLEVKMRNAQKFLDQGDKIKLMMQFRGREMAHFTIGFEKFKSIIKDIEGLGAVVEADPKPQGNRIHAMVAPSKKKK